MEISVEISFYPLTEKYNAIIEEFISEIARSENIVVSSSEMSSILHGNYDDVMNLLLNSLKPFLEKHPSVFAIKISNACGCDCSTK